MNKVFLQKEYSILSKWMNYYFKMNKLFIQNEELFYGHKDMIISKFGYKYIVIYLQ